MAIRRRQEFGEDIQLNLAPIMNMVMILIPLLLLTATFVVVQTLEVASPRNAQSTQPPEDQDPEEVPTPRVHVAITENGFTISDMQASPAWLESNLWAPIPGCPGAGQALDPMQVVVTVCNRDVGVDANLLERLDFRGLYNRLVEIYNNPNWKSQWDDTNTIINIAADREIPFDVVVRTMDVARFFLDNDQYEDDQAFRSAQYREVDNAPVKLFPTPVLLLPRASVE